jgi:hypothetical protein
VPTAAKKSTVSKSVKPASKPQVVAKLPSKTQALPKVQGPVNKPTPAKSKVAKEIKPVKVKKPKLVRDSFTIPKMEYTVLDELKARANQLASPAKKSELLRAGIKALAAMSDAALLVALKAVPAIKTGRPVKT